MPCKRCAWGTCKSDNRYKKEEHMKGVEFFRFPRPNLSDPSDAKTDLCQKWIAACRRPEYQLNIIKINEDYTKDKRYYNVCSKHFINGKPTDDSPCPIAASATPRKPMSAKRKPPKDRHNEGPPSKKKKTMEEDSEDNLEFANILLQLHSKGHNIQGSALPTPAQHIPAIPTHQPKVPSPPQKRNTKKLSRDNFMCEVFENDRSCFFYTGIPTKALFEGIYKWLEPTASKVKLWHGSGRHRKNTETRGRRRKAMLLKEEFTLTLVRIRRGYDCILLGYLFGVSESQVSRIFITWVDLMSRCMKPFIKWPSSQLVKDNLPDSFRDFPRTRVIIDCTEFFVQKPFRPEAQKLTWSTYKHSNTFKLLVGIMPSGSITFLSDLYSGAISDLSIVEKSGFCEMLEPGDDIMADRGFNIRKLLLSKRATLNIPAFSHGKSLSRKGVQMSRKIASVRIHVERAIRRMKTFKILTGIIPIKLRFNLHAIIIIVSVLCNLQEPLA